MPQFNFWDDRKEFVKVCQTIEFNHVKPFLTNEFFSDLRRRKELVELRLHVLSTPTQRPRTGFYFPQMGMTLSEVAFYDLVGKNTGEAKGEQTSNEP